MTTEQNNFLFREGTKDDADQMKMLGLLSYGAYEKDLTADNWAQLKSNLNSENLYPELLEKSKGYVCENNKEIVGMAFIVPHGVPNPIFEKEWAHIRLVGVHPEFAGHGIGKTLTKMCIDYALQTHEKIIALHTSEFMHAARHIYESMGFKKLKEIEPRFGKKYWIYTLNL